jgi:hypothetical protein
LKWIGRRAEKLREAKKSQERAKKDLTREGKNLIFGGVKWFIVE